MNKRFSHMNALKIVTNSRGERSWLWPRRREERRRCFQRNNAGVRVLRGWSRGSVELGSFTGGIWFRGRQWRLALGYFFQAFR